MASPYPRGIPPLLGTLAVPLLVLLALVGLFSWVARPPRRHAILAWMFFAALGVEGALLLAILAGLLFLQRLGGLIAPAGSWVWLPAETATAAAILLGGKGATREWRTLAIVGAAAAVLAGLLGTLLGVWFSTAM